MRVCNLLGHPLQSCPRGHDTDANITVAVHPAACASSVLSPKRLGLYLTPPSSRTLALDQSCAYLCNPIEFSHPSFLFLTRINKPYPSRMADASRISMHNTHALNFKTTHTSLTAQTSRSLLLPLPERRNSSSKALGRSPGNPLPLAHRVLTQPRLASAMALLATAATAFSEAFGM